MNESIEEWEKLMRNLHSRHEETDNPFVKIMVHINRMYQQTGIAKVDEPSYRIVLILMWYFVCFVLHI